MDSEVYGFLDNSYKLLDVTYRNSNITILTNKGIVRQNECLY